MHRFFLGLPLLLVLAISAGLGQQPDKKNPLHAYTTDLLPLTVGNQWNYTGSEKKERVTVRVERMEPVKRAVIEKGASERTELVESYVLRTRNGDKTLLEQIMVTPDGIYRVAGAGKEIKPPLKILQLPVARGSSWLVESKSETVDLKGEFFVDAVTLNLGKGDEPVWLAKTRDFKIGDQPMEASYWFKPGIGIVKQHVKSGKFDLEITFDEFRQGAGAEAPPLPPAPKLSLPEIKIK
jgi:hypothetical protein